MITFIVTSVLCSAIYKPNHYALEDVEAIVKSKYVKEYDKSKFDEYAALGAVASLGDPYSEYLSAENYDAFIESITGSYHGIGIEVFLNDSNELEISAVIESTPAEDAGLQDGDVLLKVNDFDITNESYTEAITRIRGTSGDDSNISLTVRRDGVEMNISVKRADIVSNTVFTKDIENLKYIRITNFTEDTVGKFDDAVGNIPDSCKGIIIDLRNNPGGLLNVVTKIADKLLPEGKIVYTQTRQGKQKVYNSDKNYIDIPLVIITNGGSASASEILASAVQDHKRGTLVGEKTFGKGCVQEIFRLQNGSALKLTTEYYYTPKGVCIHGTGVTPDIEVMLPEELQKASVSKLSYEQDTQLQKAVEVLTQN